MTPAPRLVRDIQGQAASLARVFEQHSGAGRTRLQEAAALLRASRRVVITGIGASLNAAIPLDCLLCDHGMASCIVEAGELLHYRPRACQDATVIMVSRSGESVEIAMLLQALRSDVPIIGVTQDPESLLARKADLVLEVGSLPDEMVAIQSYTGTLLTLHLLGMATVDQLETGCREVQALLPGMEQWTSSHLEAMREWDGFLGDGGQVHLLGRGPSYGSAMEGALLFSEIAKATATAMTVASFRHGPIEVVDGRFRGIVFAPQGRTRDLNLGLARDLVRFGGMVRVLGPMDTRGHGLQWIPTPPCPELLAPLLEVVPLQVAAQRLAELGDVVPGSFRYISQVTRDERALQAGPARDA